MRTLHISFIFSGERSHFTVSHDRGNLQVEHGVKAIKKRLKTWCITSMISYIHLPLIITVTASLGYTPFIVVTVGGVKCRSISTRYVFMPCICTVLSSRRRMEARRECRMRIVFVTADLFYELSFNVQALYCTYRRGQSLSLTFPALLLPGLYKRIQKSPQKVHNITKDAERRLYGLFNSAVGLC